MEKLLAEYLEEGRQHMQKAIEHLNNELSHIRAGKASPEMLKDIKVDVYGATTPLQHVANISLVDSRTIAIQPWDKSQLKAIEHAIFASNLGITPMNDGEFIRLTVPPLTEERRINLVKQAKQYGEDARVSLRSTRHKLLEFIKNEVKEGYPEDAGKRKEKEVEDMVHEFDAKIKDLLEAKEKEIMTV
ncbi:MAG TPA: ribosome recycling factor [Bacteroidetes bacterium]|nr:ribosome recycling factor [Bacteroidota bacterium]